MEARQARQTLPLRTELTMKGDKAEKAPRRIPVQGNLTSASRRSTTSHRTVFTSEGARFVIADLGAERNLDVAIRRRLLARIAALYLAIGTDRPATESIEHR
jgi:hypothetical protein